MAKMSKKALKGKKPQPVPKTAQASIPYTECYENGVIQTTEGTFSKTYAFNDTTFKTLSQEKQNTIYMAYQEFLNSLNPKERLTFHFVNRPENMQEKLKCIAPKPQPDGLNEFREELTDILANKIRNARNSISTEKYFTYSIDSDDVNEAMTRFMDVDTEMLKNFKRMVKDDIHPLTIDERLELMHSIMNSRAENHLFEHDASGRTTVNWKSLRKQGLSTKDLIAPAGLKFNGVNFQIGDRFGQSLFLDNIANWLNTNFIADLSESAFESTINLQIIPIPQEEAIRMIHNQSVNVTSEVMQAQQKALKNNYSPDFISMDLKNAKQQIDELQEDMMNRDQRLFFFSMVITHFADTMDELKEHYEQIKNVASKYMCSIKPLSMQQERGFGASLPLGINKTFTKRLMTTESLGIFIPFNEVSCFDENGYYYGVNTVNKTIISYNRLHGQNYNGLILGSPGSGKSFSAKREIINTLLNTDAQVCIVDPDGEYGPIAKAFKGTSIKIAPGNNVFINPMDLNVDTTYDSDGDPIAMKSDFVAGLIETMFGHNHTLTPAQRSIVDRCVIQIYRSYLEHLQSLPVGPDGKRKTIDRDYCPTLATLYDLLLSQPQAEAMQIAITLEAYTTGSFNTFAHRTNVDVENRLIVYDIRDIGTNLRDLGLKVCLNDIWNKMVENRAKGKWTWAYIDEFHLLLSSPSSAEFLKSIWKRARKFWGVPTGITQNVEDLLLSPAARAIINNSSFIMMLNQSSIDRANLAELLNLSASDVEFITNVEAGCGLLYNGKQAIPFRDEFPSGTKLYSIMSTKAGE